MTRVFSLDHKVIGIQYAITSMVFLFIGFTLMMLMRWQLAYPMSPVPLVGGLLGGANAPNGVLILPAMGIVAEVLTTNIRKPLWGYRLMVYAARRSAQADLARTRALLAASATLGLVFLAIKGFEYTTKLGHGIYPASNTSFAVYYLLRGR